MNSKLALVFLALALLVGAVAFLFQGGRESTARGPERVVKPSIPLTREGLATPELVREPEVAPVERIAKAAPVPVSSPWAGRLAGLSGRVVESDGTPVVGMQVVLLEAEATLLFTDLAGGVEPSFEVEASVTDDEGRFVLGGARGPAFHGLGLDLGGPRATLRIIDQVLVHGERTDIGDVVLAPYGVLTGRVVDESGVPVIGARVRAAPLPEEAIAVPTYDFRSDSMIAVTAMATTGQGHGIFEVPSWVQQNVDRLPIPTTYSGEDGRFRLEGVALASVVGGADKAGFVGAPLGPVDLTAGEADTGELVLKKGRTITGVVEDTSGEPVVGIEVFAGGEVVPGVAAILQSAGVTNEDGEFVLEGVLEGGQVVAAARRSTHEPWTSTVTGDPDDVLVELPENVRLTVHVQDEKGEPVIGAKIQVAARIKSTGGMMGMGELLMILPTRANVDPLFRESEPGTYVTDRISPGLYDITAHKEGLTPGFVQEEVLEGGLEVTLQCRTGHQLRLLVLDAGTGEPVPEAKALVLRASQEGFLRLDTEHTDSTGQARLGPLQEFPDAGGASLFPSQTMLVVQHPDYGDATHELLPGAPEMVSELERGGILAGRVHWGGAVPTRAYMILLEYREQEDLLTMFYPPRIGLSDHEGSFRVGNLAPGKYRFELIERFLDQDPLGLIKDQFNPVTLHREDIEISNGQTTEVEVDLTPTGRGETAAIRGRVRVDGVSIEGASVKVRGNEKVEVKTDQWGRFETPEFSILRKVRVSIRADISVAGADEREMRLYEGNLELQNGEVREIDVDLYPMTLQVRVTDALSGQPLADATVSARIDKKTDHNQDHNQDPAGAFRDEKASSDASGVATLLIPHAGNMVISVRCEGYSRASTSVEVPETGLTEPVEVLVTAQVPCRGRVQFDPGTSPENGFSYLQVRAREGGHSGGTTLQAPDYTFDIEGLSEGDYDYWLYMRQSRSTGTFTLGPEGETDLLFDFVPEAR